MSTEHCSMRFNFVEKKFCKSHKCDNKHLYFLYFRKLVTKFKIVAYYKLHVYMRVVDVISNFLPAYQCCQQKSYSIDC